MYFFGDVMNVNDCVPAANGTTWFIKSESDTFCAYLAKTMPEIRVVWSDKCEFAMSRTTDARAKAGCAQSIDRSGIWFSAMFTNKRNGRSFLCVNVVDRATLSCTGVTTEVFGSSTNFIVATLKFFAAVVAGKGDIRDFMIAVIGFFTVSVVAGTRAKNTSRAVVDKFGLAVQANRFYYGLHDYSYCRGI